jgi:hypothetical protein
MSGVSVSPLARGLAHRPRANSGLRHGTRAQELQAPVTAMEININVIPEGGTPPSSTDEEDTAAAAAAAPTERDVPALVDGGPAALSPAAAATSAPTPTTSGEGAGDSAPQHPPHLARRAPPPLAMVSSEPQESTLKK